MLQRLLCAPCSIHSLLQCHHIIHMVFGCMDGSISSKRNLTTHTHTSQPSNHQTEFVYYFVDSLGWSDDSYGKRKSINFFYILIHLSALEECVFLSNWMCSIFIVWKQNWPKKKKDERRSEWRKEEVSIGIGSTIRTKCCNFVGSVDFASAKSIL